jgi:hypothetical protein
MPDWVLVLPEKLIMLAGILVPVLLGGAGALYFGARERGRGEGWEAFARARNGRFERTGLYRVSDARIDLVSRGVAVHVAIEVREPGHPVSSRACAAWALGSGPVFRITPERALSGLDKRLGQEDLTLGDARFDAAFLVGGSSAPTLRGLLSPAVRALFVTHLREAVLTSDGAMVVVEVQGLLIDPQVLAAMVDVVAELAAHGLDELAGLAKAEGARWEPPSGAWDARTPARLELDRRGVPVSVTVRATDRGLRTELAASSSRALPTIAVRFDATGAADGEAPSGVLPPPYEARVLAGASLSASGAAARLRFEPGRTPPVPTVEAGAELLASLVRGTGSAFR